MHLLTSIAALTLMASPVPCPKDAKGPPAAVMVAFDRLVAAQSAPDQAQRERRASAVFADVLDPSTFARRALSKAWDAARNPMRQRWTRTLGAMLERKINQRLAQPQRFRLRTRRVNLWCTDARVEAVLGKRKGRYRRDLVVRLAHSAGRWRIYDLAIDGSGLLARWRRQLSRAYRDDGVGGVDALLRRLAEATPKSGKAVTRPPPVQARRDLR